MRFLRLTIAPKERRILFSPSPPRHIERDDTEVEHWAVKQSRTGRDDWDQDDPRNYG